MNNNMKKQIISLCCVAMTIAATGQIENSFVQTLNPPPGSGSGEGVTQQNNNGCTAHNFWSCTGSCTGVQPAPGTVCATSTDVYAEYNGKECTTGTTPITGTQVTASCTGYASCVAATIGLLLHLLQLEQLCVAQQAMLVRPECGVNQNHNVT